MYLSNSEAAKKILQAMKNLQRAETYVEVNESLFSHLDLKTYGHIRDFLSGNRFHRLADLEWLEFSKSNALFKPTMLRIYLSKDRSTVVSHYQLKPSLPRLLLLLIKGIINFRFIAAPMFVLEQLHTKNIFDFETEFVDGNYLVTSNAAHAGLLSLPTSIKANFFPVHTPVEIVMTEHTKKLQKRLLAGAKATAIHSLSESRQMQNRLKLLKDAYRLSIQYINQDEIRAMGSNTAMSDAIFHEIKKLLDEEKQTNSC